MAVDNLAHLNLGTSEDFQTDNKKVLGNDKTSEISFESNATDLSTISLSVQSLIGDEALKSLLEEQTLEDLLIVPKDISLEEEVRLLRRQIQISLYNPTPEITVQKLLQGKRVSLEVYRSFQDKQKLLDAVIRSGCPGDALIYVLLFIERSLKRELFYELLKARPIALEHYLTYLQESHPEETIEVLRFFKQDDRAAIMEFESILNRKEATKEKRLSLQRLLASVLDESTTSSHKNTVNSVYLQLMESSLKLMDFSSKFKCNEEHFSPVEMLYNYYLLGNNFGKEPSDKSGSFSIPLQFCVDQNISNAQFEWTVLNACARSKSYGILEGLFEKDGRWPGIKTKQFQINFALESAIQRLYDLEAPNALIYRFLARMANSDEKLELAKRVDCIKMVIDVLLLKKDSKALQTLRQTIDDKSELQFHCDNALKSLQEKRWLPDNIKRKL